MLHHIHYNVALPQVPLLGPCRPTGPHSAVEVYSGQKEGGGQVTALCSSTLLFVSSRRQTVCLIPRREAMAAFSQSPFHEILQCDIIPTL